MAPLVVKEWVTISHQPVLTAVALLAVYLVWGSTYLAIAIALEGFPPLLLMGLRSVVAAGILYGIARVRGAGAPNRAAWRNALLVGVLFFVGGHGLLAWGETRVPSGAAAVVIATEPLFIVLLARVGGSLAGGAPPTIPSLPVRTAVFLGLAGVAVMMAPGTGGGLDPIGMAALLLASLSWSAGTFQVDSQGSPVRAAGMQLLAGGAILLCLALATGEFRSLELATITSRSIVALVYLVVFGSVVTFGAYVWLLPRLGPARLSTHTFVNPLVALMLGAWIGGETLGRVTLVASGLVLLAVALLLTSGKKRAAAAHVVPAAPFPPEPRA